MLLSLRYDTTFVNNFQTTSISTRVNVAMGGPFPEENASGFFHGWRMAVNGSSSVNFIMDILVISPLSISKDFSTNIYQSQLKRNKTKQTNKKHSENANTFTSMTLKVRKKVYWSTRFGINFMIYNVLQELASMVAYIYSDG